jgi:Bacterial membrane protein YfhO
VIKLGGRLRLQQPSPSPAGEPPERHADLSRRAVVLLFAAVTLLALGRPLLGQGAFLAADLLRQAPPWRAQTEPSFRAHNAVLGDTIDWAFPSKERFWRELRGGELHLWTDDVGGGGPVLPAYPVSAPFDVVYLVLPSWYAPGASAALRLLAAMVLTYGFLRRLGTARWAATLAGVAYGLTGFFGAWTNWPHTNVSVLLPGLFWAAEAIWQDPRARRVVPLALVLAGMAVGGFPAVAAYGIYALAGYLAVRVVSDRRPLRQGASRLGRPLAAAACTAAGGLLGVLLSAFYLLPFAELLRTLDLSSRVRPPGLDAAASHLDPRHLLTLISPSPFGNRYEGVYWGPPPTWPEAVTYAGVAVLVLAGWALALPRRPAPDPPDHPSPRPGPALAVAAYFWGLVLVMLVILFSGGPLTRLANQLPGVGGNFIGRTRVLVDFGLAVLAGLGAHAWHRLLTRQEDRAVLARRLRLVALGLAIAAVLVLVASSGFLLDYVREVSERGLRRYTAARFAVPLAAGAATLALLALAWAGRARRVLRWGLLGVVAAEMLVFFVPINPVTPRALFYDSTPAHRFLDANLGGARMGGSNLAFFPNSNVVYGLADLRGHTFHQPAYVDLLRAVHPRVMRTRTVALFPADVDLGSPLLDLLGVRYWSEDERLPVRGRRIEGPAPGTGTVDPARDPPAPRVVLPPGGLRAVELMVRERPASGQRLTVEVAGADGKVLASGERRLWTLGRGRWESVTLAGDGLPAGAAVTLRVRTGEAPGRVALVGGAGGELAYRLVAGAEDGLRVAFGDGVVIYERRTAQPLARFYGGYEVVAGAQAVTRLRDTPAAGRDRALTSAAVPGLAPGPGQGVAGAATIRSWQPGDIRVDVDAGRAGLLVLAVNRYPGWEATVDGRDATIVRADHAFQGVAVPAGRHSVRLRYRPGSFTLGLALTLAGLALCGLLWLAPAWRARRPSFTRRARDDRPAAG